MPTPFYHLNLASELLQHAGMPEALRQFLSAYRAEFMLGNTAPDVQVVSGQPRENTHFFSIPILPGEQLPWDCMLSEYPQLAQAADLSEDQAAFLAGYVCHLQADWIWIKEIYTPVFGPFAGWETFKQRLYYHNVLRAYLDRQILAKLPADTAACLTQVVIDNWLPFIKGRFLEEWRDFVAKQLGSGGTIQTVEVFSARQGISSAEFYAVLESDERMSNEVFNHLPLDRVRDYNQCVLSENIRLLTCYLAFTLHPKSLPVDQRSFRGAQL